MLILQIVNISFLDDKRISIWSRSKLLNNFLEYFTLKKALIKAASTHQFIGIILRNVDKF